MTNAEQIATRDSLVTQLEPLKAKAVEVLGQKDIKLTEDQRAALRKFNSNAGAELNRRTDTTDLNQRITRLTELIATWGDLSAQITGLVPESSELLKAAVADEYKVAQKQLDTLSADLADHLEELAKLEDPSEPLAERIAKVRKDGDAFGQSARLWSKRTLKSKDEPERTKAVDAIRKEIAKGEKLREWAREVIEQYRSDSAPSYAVTLQRSESRRSEDQPLWSLIRNRTLAIGFNPYRDFIDRVMCYIDQKDVNEFPDKKEHERKEFELRLPFMRADAYTKLKVATELFLMQECGIVDPGIRERQTWDFVDASEHSELFENKPERDRKRLYNRQEEAARLGRRRGALASRDDLMNSLKEEYLVKLGNEFGYTLPYFSIIRDKLKEVPLKGPDIVPPNCYGILKSHLTGPCLLELIWSFWHEAGFLMRTMHVVNRRFQNIRGADRDPLMRFDLDTLRPLGNLLWGHISDEQHRLTVQRRIYEYDHHYGLRLQSRVGALHPADSRSKFIAGFHNLLYLTSVFYKEDDDTTVIADAFRVLNALREVHLLLAEGAHNQFGDLPWTARAEMLIEQWLLARPEMLQFLGGRIAVPYAEGWMDRVDTMKTLQGWTDVSITHFHDLAVCGEQILLAVRYGNWSVVNFGPSAANWARYWRPEIQRYIHAYQAVTGVDLAIEPVDTTSPAELLRQRALAPR